MSLAQSSERIFFLVQCVYFPVEGTDLNGVELKELVGGRRAGGGGTDKTGNGAVEIAACISVDVRLGIVTCKTTILHHKPFIIEG